MTQQKCKREHHIYISGASKPRWCVWCNTREDVEKPAPKTKRTKKSPTKSK